jgi:hypothetical protein
LFKNEWALGLNLTNTSVYASPGVEAKPTIRKAAAVVTTVDSKALVELPVWVEPVLVLCTAAKKVLVPKAD